MVAFGGWVVGAVDLFPFAAKRRAILSLRDSDLLSELAGAASAAVVFVGLDGSVDAWPEGESCLLAGTAGMTTESVLFVISPSS